MSWYSALITKEYTDYFASEDSVYFSVSSKGKIYNETYVKFRETVQNMISFFCCDRFEDSVYYKIKDTQSYLYKLAESFYEDKNRPDFKAVYHSIQGNVFDCDTERLSAEQLAVGLIFPFASRMDGSFEDIFAESGRLRQFVLTLREKSEI